VKAAIRAIEETGGSCSSRLRKQSRSVKNLRYGIEQRSEGRSYEGIRNEEQVRYRWETMTRATGVVKMACGRG